MTIGFPAWDRVGTTVRVPKPRSRTKISASLSPILISAHIPKGAFGADGLYHLPDWRQGAAPTSPRDVHEHQCAAAASFATPMPSHSSGSTDDDVNTQVRTSSDAH